MDELVKTVYGMVAEQVSVDESVIQLESRFVEDLNADSLDIAELVMKLEERFGISISDEEATGLRTVGEAIGFLRRRLNDGAAAA